MYEILKDFTGSQDGRFSEDFRAGTRAELSDYLANAAPPGAIRRLPAAREIDNKAIVADGGNPRQRRIKE